MNGVTILDTMEIYTLSCWQFELGFTPMIVALIISLVHLWIDFKKGTKEEQERGVISTNNHKPWEILYAVIGGILSLILILSLDGCCPANYLETRYKVKVDETTPFVEFYDKYNILEEHPEYFIVTEKSK